MHILRHFDDVATCTRASGHFAFLTKWWYTCIVFGLGILDMWLAYELESRMMRNGHSGEILDTLNMKFDVQVQPLWFCYESVVQENVANDKGKLCVCSNYAFDEMITCTRTSGHFDENDVWSHISIVWSLADIFVHYEPNWNHINAWDRQFGNFWLWNEKCDVLSDKMKLGFFCFCMSMLQRW